MKDGSTRWRVRVYIGQDPDTGKRTYFTGTYDKKKDADREATRLERAKDLGVLTQTSKEPFVKYLIRWLDEVKAGRIADRTLHDYRGIVRRYIEEPPDGAPPIGKIRLDRLTGAAFEALYAFLWKEQGLAPRTLKYLHSILRQALGHAVRTGAVPRNPTDAVKPPRQAYGGGRPKTLTKAMTKEEAGRFFQVAAEDPYEALWIVLLMGGLRPSEAFGLKWTDVDLEGGRIHISRSLTRRGMKGWRLVEPKTPRARRVVVLPEVAISALREHRRVQAEQRLKLGEEWQDHGFVFTATFGTPLDIQNVYRRYSVVLEKARLGEWTEPEEGGGKRKFKKGFRLYDLRHSCATLLLLAGENVKVVSERLGHASVILTLDTYAHVLPSMQEASADKLQAMFGSG
jgi:integrase